MGLIEDNKEKLFTAIEKPLNEILAEFERRQRGAEERLGRARVATDKMKEALLSVQWKLRKLSQEREVLERLPPEWQEAIAEMKKTLKDNEREVKILRDRDGW